MHEHHALRSGHALICNDISGRQSLAVPSVGPASAAPRKVASPDPATSQREQDKETDKQ